MDYAEITNYSSMNPVEVKGIEIEEIHIANNIRWMVSLSNGRGTSCCQSFNCLMDAKRWISGKRGELPIEVIRKF